MPLRDPQALPHSGPIFCFGFHPWKHAYVRHFLHGLGRPVLFPSHPLVARLRGLDAASSIVVWGLRDTPGVLSLARRHGLPIWRMEDGFLRSAGLGSDRYQPASLVLDRQGIYYDPTRPSDLESILAHDAFSPDDLARAASLRESIVRLGVSKYNVGDRLASLPRLPEGRTVVLVPGQVEDDASIQLGCVDVRTNTALLEQVRAARPDAFVLFKPHPDVVSGNRRGAVPDAIARKLADAVVLDAPLPACLSIAHEVHTMTSLVGFEGLLRNLSVSVYGLPFYAGWGLTHDRHAHARRTRRLSLDELVCAALIRYPLYLDPVTSRSSTPEAIVAALAAASGGAVRQHWLKRKLRKLDNAVRGVLGR